MADAIDSEPVFGPVGQEIHIECPAKSAPGVFGKVKWERVDDDLPYEYTISNGMLSLRDLQRNDSGIYKCTLATEQGFTIVTYTKLIVSDFVPLFDEHDFYELNPKEMKRWNDIDITLSIKPRDADGLLLYVESVNEREEEQPYFMSVGLKNGKVVQLFDVGQGLATLVVDSDDITSRGSTAQSKEVSLPIRLGGNKDAYSKTAFTKGFSGIVSQVWISGESVDLGEETSAKSYTLVSSNVCTAKPCRNGGQCIPSNAFRGFLCDCARAAQYEGEFCERKSKVCMPGVKCEMGACLTHRNGSFRCLCPYDREGKFCETFRLGVDVRGLSFDGQYSYIALPSPKSLQSFNLSLKVRFNSASNQMIVYLGSNYDSNEAHFFGIIVRNKKLVVVQNDGNGNIDTNFPNNIMPHQEYLIEIKITGDTNTVRVNGKGAENFKKISFIPGTDLFIGGIPPGVILHHKFKTPSPLSGCILQIQYSQREMNLKDVGIGFSGGLSTCDYDIVSAIHTDANVNDKTIDDSTDFNTERTIEVLPSISDAEILCEDDDQGCAEEVTQCKRETCGEHGVCEAENETHISCSCRDYYTGPNCNIFKPVEHAAEFNGKAFIVFSTDDFPHLTSEKEETIELRFKTISESGLIFWQGQQPGTTLAGEDYISLALDDGFLVYSFELGSGAAHITSVEPVNDGKEHQLKATRTGRSGSLQVDKSDPVQGLSHGLLAMLNVEGDIYIGGVPDLEVMTARLHEENFNGCIGDIALNGVRMDLMANAIDGRNVKPCEQWVLKKKELRSRIVSQVWISGESVDLGEETSAKSYTLVSSNVCTAKPCRNGGQCIPSNAFRGFLCDCARAAQYEGEFCERKSKVCMPGVKCEMGACLTHRNGSFRCLCPYDREGKFCETFRLGVDVRGLSFDGQYSYIALPSPKSLQSFNLSLKVRFNSASNQMIVYLGSNYDSNEAHFFGIIVRNKKLVVVQNDGNGNIDTNFPNNIMPHQEYLIEIKITGDTNTVRVNGKGAENFKKISFIPGTDLFIGGIPPGVILHHKFKTPSPLSGCILQIQYSQREMNLKDVGIGFSGGLSTCDYDIVSAIHTDANVNDKTIDDSTDFNTERTIEVLPSISDAEILCEDDDQGCAEEVTQCKRETCGEHGVCEAENETHISCSCRDYYTGPNCNIFKPVEHAAEFNGKAFIVFSTDDFPHLTSEKEETIELRFKTISESGLIFWQGQQPGTTLAGEDYISLALDDGFLVYSFELGSGAAHITSVEPVNDGKEHQLKATRTGRSGSLQVDKSDPVQGLSHGLLAMLNVEGDIYIGGVPDLEVMTARLHEENFNGCIGDIALNGVRMDLMANAIDGRNVKPCEQWVLKKKELRSRKY